MGQKSKIAWTEYNWEVTGGCDKRSNGCRECYAIKLIGNRFAKNPIFNGRYEGLVKNGNWTGKIKLFEDRLIQPAHWKKPRMVFVNSRSDLFHPKVPFEFIRKVFEVIYSRPYCTFQILTKRPERMLEFMNSYKTDVILFPNVWLGVSVEDQKTADERIPLLLQTPAAVRWISAEPLLEPIDLTTQEGLYAIYTDYLTGTVSSPFSERDDSTIPKENHLNWIIIGGESGPKARECNIEWIRDIVNQCRVAKVPVFVKQLGSKLIYEKTNDIFAGAKIILDGKGKNDKLENFPEDLQIRQYPNDFDFA